MGLLVGGPLSGRQMQKHVSGNRILYFRLVHRLLKEPACYSLCSEDISVNLRCFHLQFGCIINLAFITEVKQPGFRRPQPLPLFPCTRQKKTRNHNLLGFWNPVLLPIFLLLLPPVLFDKGDCPKFDCLKALIISLNLGIFLRL